MSYTVKFIQNEKPLYHQTKLNRFSVSLRIVFSCLNTEKFKFALSMYDVINFTLDTFVLASVD